MWNVYQINTYTENMIVKIRDHSDGIMVYQYAIELSSV